MRRPFLSFWPPVYLYAAAIFVFSSIPAPLPVAWEIPFLDKGLHLVEYGILGYLLARALANDSPSSLRESFRFWAILFTFLYGITDEWHQSFVPLRQATAADALMDGLGAFIGQCLVHRSHR